MIYMTSLEMSGFRHSGLMIVVAMLLVVAGAATTYAQEAKYTVVFATTITSGSYAGDIDIAQCGFDHLGQPDRPIDSPRVVAAQTLREFEPAAASDCAGGYVLVYTVERYDSAGMMDRDIYARHIDSAGNNLWNQNDRSFVPVAESRLVEDHPSVLYLGDGSTLIAYEVHYGPAPWSDVDIVVVRLGIDGATLVAPFWGVKSKRRERLAAMVPNGTGGAYIVINTETYRDSTLVNSDIYLQRIDTSGVIGWKDSPEPVPIAASRHFERNASAVVDGENGIYVAYELEYNGDGRSGDVDILAQRIGEYGRRRWINDEALPIVSSSPRARESNPRIAAVEDGIVVAFRFESTIDRKSISAVGLQKLDTAGRPVWNEGKRSKLIALPNRTVIDVCIASDQLGGVYLGIEARDSTVGGHTDVLVQRCGFDGEQLWGEGSAPLPVFASEDNESNSIIIVNTVGVLTALAIRDPVASRPGLYSALVGVRLSPEGTSLWNDEPTTLVTTPTRKSRPAYIHCR